MDVGNAGVAGSIHLPLALWRRSEKARLFLLRSPPAAAGTSLCLVRNSDSGILLTDMDVGNAGVAGSIHLPLAPWRGCIEIGCRLIADLEQSGGKRRQ
jgi:hypothetical protein